MIEVQKHLMSVSLSPSYTVIDVIFRQAGTLAHSFSVFLDAVHDWNYFQWNSFDFYAFFLDRPYTVLPEYALPYAIYLMANHPDFDPKRADSVSDTKE